MHALYMLAKILGEIMFYEKKGIDQPQFLFCMQAESRNLETHDNISRLFQRPVIALNIRRKVHPDEPRHRMIPL